MADSNTPKKVEKNVHGGTNKKTPTEPHGGGTNYNQLAPGKGFMVHDAKPGSAHNTKGTNNQK